MHCCQGPQVIFELSWELGIVLIQDLLGLIEPPESQSASDHPPDSFNKVRVQLKRLLRIVISLIEIAKLDVTRCSVGVIGLVRKYLWRSEWRVYYQLPL